MPIWKPAYHKDQRTTGTPIHLFSRYTPNTNLLLRYDLGFARLVLNVTKSRRITLFLNNGKPGIKALSEEEYPVTLPW